MFKIELTGTVHRQVGLGTYPSFIQFWIITNVFITTVLRNSSPAAICMAICGSGYLLKRKQWHEVLKLQSYTTVRSMQELLLSIQSNRHEETVYHSWVVHGERSPLPSLLLQSITSRKLPTKFTKWRRVSVNSCTNPEHCELIASLFLTVLGKCNHWNCIYWQASVRSAKKCTVYIDLPQT